MGTLGSLDQSRAAQSHLAQRAVAKLRETSFRYPKRLVERLLEEHVLRQEKA